MLRITSLLSGLLVIVAACGGDMIDDGGETGVEDGGTASTTAPAATTTPEEDPLFVGPRGSAPPSGSRPAVPGFGCVVMAGFVIGVAGLDALDAVDDVEAVLEATTVDGTLTLPQADLDTVLGNQGLQLYEAGAAGPFAAAAANPGLVFPIPLLVPANHWSWAPGEDAWSVTRDLAELIAWPPSGEPSRTVFVIDSPFYTTAESELNRHVTNWDQASRAFIGGLANQSQDPSDASHGGFIASLIRQLNPRSAVRVITPGLIRPIVDGSSTLVGQEMANGPAELTGYTGLTVLAAVQLAAEQAATLNEGEEAVLNFSLGTYPCHDPSDSDQVLPAPPIGGIASAVAAWSGLTGGADFFAAAGNGWNDMPFYPAALSDEHFDGIDLASSNETELPHAVSAMAWDGQTVVAWHGNDSTVRVGTDAPPFPAEPAPGLDLVSYSGEQLISWSGSSFATAVASAVGLGSSYQIPRLAYVDEGGFLVVNPG